MEKHLGDHLRDLPGPVLITGHTGFIGTWMTLFFERLNIPVVGYSLQAEKGSLFDTSNRRGVIPESYSDIRDYSELASFIDKYKPSVIVHLAAQPLVIKSFESPLETFQVNVTGTTNLIDIAFKREFVKAILVFTTDKVYKNCESGHAFNESDPLDGSDPYSASKVAVELAISSWQEISKTRGGPKLVSVRAGNVIGGGDVAQNRIMPDLIRGINQKSKVRIRNPASSRPWQHVLDPIFGSTLLLEHLLNEVVNIRAMNFGPKEFSLPVSELIDIIQSAIPVGKLEIEYERAPSQNWKEMKSLNLDSSFAERELGWNPAWSQTEAIRSTLTWWEDVLSKLKLPKDAISNDIDFLLAKSLK